MKRILKHILLLMSIMSAISVACLAKDTYTQISQEEASKMMELDDGHIIVDVRRQDEYDEGHMNKPGMDDTEKYLNRTGYAHIAFSVGSKEKVDALTERLQTEGYKVVSGPRTTGDGYYESCIIAVEGNQIEITE